MAKLSGKRRIVQHAGEIEEQISNRRGVGRTAVTKKFFQNIFAGPVEMMLKQPAVASNKTPSADLLFLAAGRGHEIASRAAGRNAVHVYDGKSDISVESLCPA